MQIRNGNGLGASDGGGCWRWENGFRRGGGGAKQKFRLAQTSTKLWSAR